MVSLRQKEEGVEEVIVECPRRTSSHHALDEPRDAARVLRAFSAPDHQAARVGGRARIELGPLWRRDPTGLLRAYQQVPVRLMPPFVFDHEPASLLYLINLTAGLMDGDGHLVQIKARAGTRCVVTGQSATRVHPAVASYATQQWSVEVEDDACLVVLPCPDDPVPG